MGMQSVVCSWKMVICGVLSTFVSNVGQSLQKSWVVTCIEHCLVAFMVDSCSTHMMR